MPTRGEMLISSSFDIRARVNSKKGETASLSCRGRSSRATVESARNRPRESAKSTAGDPAVDEYFDKLGVTLQDWDVAKLEHDGWRMTFFYSTPIDQPRGAQRTCHFHPDYGWVFTRAKRRGDRITLSWSAIPIGDLGVTEFKGFRSVWDAIGSLTPTPSGAA